MWEMSNNKMNNKKLFDEIDAIMKEVNKIIKMKFKFKIYPFIIINEETYSYGYNNHDNLRCHCDRSFCACN